MKPLLQVTNTEEKLNVKEQELKQVADRFDKLRVEHEDLERKQQQMAEEKNALAEQLQAEAELAAEAEEVCSSIYLLVSETSKSYNCFTLLWLSF